jgi:hypothetical protein
MLETGCEPLTSEFQSPNTIKHWFHTSNYNHTDNIQYLPSFSIVKPWKSLVSWESHEPDRWTNDEKGNNCRASCPYMVFEGPG